jgi:hypothetical protein
MLINEFGNSISYIHTWYEMQMLLLLEVEKLVVPAIPDMVNTWTKSFSFRLLEPTLKEEIKNTSLVIFAETMLLEKTIYKAQLLDKQGTVSGTSRMQRKNSNLI